MKTHRTSPNVYTDKLLQHPNIILGSLQLLFWYLFRPSVWNNQIKYLSLFSSRGILLKNFSSSDFWKQKEIQRILLQVLFIIPVLGNTLMLGALVFAFNPPSFWVRLLVSTTIMTLVYGFVGISSGLNASMYLVQASSFFGLLVFFCRIVFLFSRNAFLVFYIIIFCTGLVLGLGVNTLNGLNSFKSIFTNNSSKKTRNNAVILDVLSSVFLSLIVGSLFVIQVGFSYGVTTFITFLLGYAMGRWRSLFIAILLVPWHALIYQIDQNRDKKLPSLLPLNLAVWDEFQDISILGLENIWGLDKHLLLVVERNSIEGQAALNYLSTSRQRWAAQSAQIELDARQLEKCADASAIGQIQQILMISELASPADTIFRSFNSISVDVDVALRQFSTYNQRLALTDVANRLNNLTRELTTSSDKYAVRFRPIAQRWQNIIDLHLQDLIKESELRQEIDSPYIIGVPVTSHQQLFVGRTDISERLEKLLLDRRSPPLLLYGQRRMGKTSLLLSLGRLLPTSIIPLFVDLQGSTTRASDHSSFLYNLAKEMIDSAFSQRNSKLPPLSQEDLIKDPFTVFDEWLNTLEKSLGNRTALLALDEFEELDRVLRIGRFNEADILGMLRNLIQHRPRFKVLISGSHTLDEFQHWSSYLINAQVLHLECLQETEARQLIEQPIENFALRYEPSASQRVLDITRGHPLFVQLLCAEIVAFKNNQDPSIRRLATLADVEAAIPEALEHGSMFFSDIQRNQLDAPALAVLRYCAQQGEAATISKSELAQQFTVGLEGAIDLLLRRELIETKPSGYSIQLELIRRWFA